MTFPDDIMQAAREAFIAADGPQMDRASAERIRAGVIDETPALAAVATAILAERQRCASKAMNMAVPMPNGRATAEAHNAACRAIAHAISEPNT